MPAPTSSTVTCCGNPTFGAADALAQLEANTHWISHVSSNGWDTGAQLSPPTAEEFVPLQAEFKRLKANDRWTDESYLQRVAILILYYLKNPRWSWASQCGAAWGAIISGMHSHGYEISKTPGAAAKVMKPPPHFFDWILFQPDPIEEIVTFLRSCYENSRVAAHAREWRMNQLALCRHRLAQHRAELMRFFGHNAPHNFIVRVRPWAERGNQRRLLFAALYRAGGR